MSLFGGSDKKAIKAQKQENALTREFLEKMSQRARDDIFSIWPGVPAARMGGYGAAIGAIGNAIPQSIDVYQQGNVGAQAQLLAGLDQYQNAIYGMPVDTSSWQPQQLDVGDLSWLGALYPEQPGGSVPGGTTPDGNDAVAGDSQTGGLGTNNGDTQAGTGQPTFNDGRSGGGVSNQNWWWGGTRPGPGSSGGGNRFADTYNANPIAGAMGYNDIGSLDQLWLSENAGRIGSIVSMLSGVPGLKWLGKALGNYNIDNKTWMSPVNPDDPYNLNGTYGGSGMDMINAYFGANTDPGNVSADARMSAGWAPLYHTSTDMNPLVGDGMSAGPIRSTYRDMHSRAIGNWGQGPAWYATRINREGKIGG